MANRYQFLIDQQNGSDTESPVVQNRFQSLIDQQNDSIPSSTADWRKIEDTTPLPDIKPITHTGFFDPQNDGGGHFLPGNLDNTAFGKFLTRTNWNQDPAHDNVAKPDSSLPWLADLLGGVEQFAMGGKGGGGALGSEVYNLGSNAFKGAANKLLPELFQGGIVGNALAAGTGGLALTAADNAVNNRNLSAKDYAISAGENALLGGAMHGAGQLLGKGVELGTDYSRFNKATQLPELGSNPLADVQDAYKSPNTLRDVKAQQLNNTFADTSNNLGQTGTTLPRQGMNPAELLQHKQADAQSVFGGPVDPYYHGSPIKFDSFNPEKTGGLINLTQNEGTAYKYASGGGGARASINDSQKYVADGFDNIFEKQGNLWTNIGKIVSDDGKPLEIDRTKITENPMTDSQVNNLIDKQDRYVINKNPNIMKLQANIKNTLDLTTPEGVKKLSTLSNGGNFKVDGIIEDAKQGNFSWSSTKHEASMKIWKDIINPQLEKMGYDSIKFADDNGYQNHTTAVFHPEQLSKYGQETKLLRPNILDRQGTPPEKPQPLQWTNKDNIAKAELPYRSLVNGDRLQPELAQDSRIETNSGINPNNLGHSQIVPSMSMRLQRFNNDIPTLPDTASHIVSKTERQPISFDAIKTNAYIKTTDNLHRLDQLDKYVEGVTGEKLSPKDRSYMLALNSRGVGSTTSHILEENLVNPKGEVIGDSLKTITKQLKNKDTMKAFDDYLVNKHAITRMKAGEKVYPDEMAMTPEMSEAKVKQIEALHPEFKDLSNKLYDFQNKLTKSWLVDTGIVSSESYGKWIIDNPNYVPNNRLFSEMEKPSFSGTKRGFSNQSNPVKARTGSQRQIISPLESIMEHTDQYVKVAKRNEVMQTLIRNIQKNPDEFKGWAEVIPSDGQLKEGLMGDINKTLQTQGIDGVVEQFNKQFDDIFNAKKQRLDLGNVVTGLVNGEKVHVKINDPLLLDALTNLKPQAQQVVIAALGRVTRVMKNLTTGINPVFGLARNIWRDIPTAFINSKSTINPLVFGKDLLGSIVDVMGNKELYKSYKAMGGGHASSSVSTGRDALAESKARLLPGYALKHPFKSALGGLERLNNAVETAPRLGEFKRVSAHGDYNSKVKGIFESNDVTTNFNKFGNWTKEADSVIPYLNAAWQGIDKLVRTFKDNPIQASAKALVAVTFPTIALYQINHRNPAYQQLSDYIKDNNFLIPKGDGTFIKIPKPREIGVVFGSSVERLMRQWQESDPEPFNRFMETVKTNFSPPVRSILAPLNDIRSNKDFMDRPIVSGAVSKLSPSLQFDEKTSEPAKKLGGLLNQSPQQIDYLARSYLGGVAQLGLPALTKNASVGGVLKKQITADPVFSNDIMGDFYNTKDKIDTSASDAKATGNKSLEVGQKYKPLFTKTNTELGDIRKQVDKIQAGPLSNADKEAKIRDLQIKMLTIAKGVNDKFKLK